MCTRLTYCFFSHPSNTACADCRAKLFLDGRSNIFVSSHRSEDNDGAPSFAVYVCTDCARAHRTLSHRVARLRSLLSDEPWDPAELALVTECSNASVNARLERHVPHGFRWEPRDRAAPSTVDREVFVRAKYDALAFVVPGSLQDDAPTRRRVRGRRRERNAPSRSEPPPPSRPVDFFCVVGSTGEIERTTVAAPRRTTAVTDSVKYELRPRRPTPRFHTAVLDCYPPRDFYEADGEEASSIPDQINRFVFPEGCAPSLHRSEPSFRTFVLTSGNGSRLYGAALIVWEENTPKELRNTFGNLRYSSFYVPKCLCILSHWSFFDLFHGLLLQTYHISQSARNNPLPVERYVAHFTREIPLPPRGKICVQISLLPQLPFVTLSRPPVNALPRVGVSLQPLFRCLSVGNVMTVVGCLAVESQVVLCSRHYPLLTPCAQALLSLLYPFSWTNVYVPVLPYHMVVDVLHAPTPFLVGVHSRYLDDDRAFSAEHRLVLVDLDEDVVHLGHDDEDVGDGGPRRVCGRRTPALPRREAHKLRRSLREHADAVYAPRPDRQRTNVTYGDRVHMDNADREEYALQTRDARQTVEERTTTLERSEKAYEQSRDSAYNFGMRADRSVISQGRVRKVKSLERDEDIEERLVVTNMYDDGEGDETDRFSATKIRQAFLRFFVSVLLNYDKYLNTDDCTFDAARFVSNVGTNDGPLTKDFVASMADTQMFSHFIDRSFNHPDDPEVLFFHEHVTAKRNRKKNPLNLKQWNKNATTPFLDDVAGEITETYTPTPPSARDRGNVAVGRAHYYPRFPRINPEAIGPLQPARRWKDDTSKFLLSAMPTPPPAPRPTLPHRSLSVVWGDDRVLDDHRRGDVAVDNAAALSKEFLLTGTRDLEWAFQALAYKYFEEDDAETFLADVLDHAQGLVNETRARHLRTLRGVARLQARQRRRTAVREHARRRRAVVTLQRWTRRLLRRWGTLRVFTKMVVTDNCCGDAEGTAGENGDGRRGEPPTNPQDFELVLCVPSEVVI